MILVSECGGSRRSCGGSNHRRPKPLTYIQMRRFAAVNLRRLRRSSETRRKQGCGGYAAVVERTPHTPYAPIGALWARNGAV
jgi:hypothetical protein